MVAGMGGGEYRLAQFAVLAGRTLMAGNEERRKVAAVQFPRRITKEACESAVPSQEFTVEIHTKYGRFAAIQGIIFRGIIPRDQRWLDLVRALARSGHIFLLRMMVTQASTFIREACRQTGNESNR